MTIDLCKVSFRDFEGEEKLYGKIYNLHFREKGEAGEEPHGATNEAQLSLQGHLHIFLQLVICGCPKINVNKLQHWIALGRT